MGIKVLSQLLRYSQTIRHLKARQLWYMGLYRALPQRYRRPPEPSAGDLILRRNVSRRTEFVPPIPQAGAVIQSSGKFTFVGKTVHLGWPPNWKMADKGDRLWCYNLHYHDYIWPLAFEEARLLAESWIDSCPFLHGAASWRPYPISVRLGNWLKYFLGVHAERCRAEPVFTEKLVKSIAVQTAWLLKNIEMHLLGNHLFENAVALCLVGVFFDGPLADRCAKRGLGLLQREMNEQILPDGGHFERSPMYHSRCLYLLADLYNLGMEKVIPQLEDFLLRMWSWLRCMCHPDGQIALFNDAAHNVYLAPVSLSAYLTELLQREPSHVSGAFGLSDSGYYGWAGHDDEYVVCDAGSIGPDYQPGHAHADLFSFELSLNGQRMIVDSGTSTYGAGPEREYLRGTAAHNTAEVNGRNQVDVWGSFRVGRRVKPHDVHFNPSPDGFALSAWHDGYKHDFGISHKRMFVFRKNHDLRITDLFRGISTQCIHTRLHFTTSCSVTFEGATCVVKNQSAALTITLDGYTILGVEETPVSLDLGSTESAHCLILDLPNGTTSGNIAISWRLP